MLNNGNVNVERMFDIVQEDVVQFALYIDQNVFLIFNARLYAALVVRDYLFEDDIETITWPAQNPDLNRIEHV